MYREDIAEDNFPSILDSVAAFAKGLGVADLQPGDIVVVVKRKVMTKDSRITYDDQRLIVKALVLGKVNLRFNRLSPFPSPNGLCCASLPALPVSSG